MILAGISLGNWLGGMLADRAASRALLGLILLAGAAATLLILPLAQLAPDWVGQVPLLLRIVLLTGMLFLAPALILGMVSPMVVKLTLSDISVTGNVVGRIYAVSTAGAIVGVFLTGFVLIQALGSRETLLILAVFTAVMAVGTGRLWHIPGRLLAGILLLGALGVFAWSQQSLTSGCVAESNYYCIKVWERELEGNEPVRVLALDRLVHSYSRPMTPRTCITATSACSPWWPKRSPRKSPVFRRCSWAAAATSCRVISTRSIRRVRLKLSRSTRR